MNVILIAVISLGSYSAGIGRYSLRGFQEICRV